MAKYRSDTGLELDDSDPDDRKILERQRAVAKKAGADGDDRAKVTRGRSDLEQAYDEGAAPKAAPSAPAAAKASKPAAGRASKLRSVAGAVPTPTLTPPKKLKAGDMGGFAFGLLLYALAVSYIRYGAKGPTGWLSAKFLNKPIQGEDLERENNGGSRHEDPNSVPWEDLTPEERENII